MKVNWLWDSRLSERRVKTILRDGKNPRFDIYAEKLLSRIAEPAVVFDLMDETVFAQSWPRVKRKMQEDRWLNKERVIFWQTMYERVCERLKEQGVKLRRPQEVKIPPVRMKLAKQIREAREKLGYTQRDAAKKLGVIQQYVSRIESGYENFSVDTLKRIADVFGKGLVIGLK